MKKFFILMFCIIAQYSFVSAQAIMKIWENGSASKTVLTTAVDSITFKSLTNGVIMIDGHKFVDLGLPSGLLWATCNIGAATPADDGNYYAWGETVSKSCYDWDTYKYGTLYSNKTKYNSTDGKTILDKEDDAAYVNWGSSCRMPTDKDFDELQNSKNCTWKWTSRTNYDGSSINGYIVTSTKNNNSIFLPASGFRSHGNLYYHGSYGNYWSSTLHSRYSDYAYYLYFYSGNRYQYSNDRYIGYTIRPVAEFK